MNAEAKTRAGFAAIIGAPNAGKSTLVNRLVGRKVSIVTHKVQTTRFPVRGVMMRDKAQVVLVDTPGVFAPRRRLDRAMVAAAWAGAEDADAIVHVVDAAAEARCARDQAKGQDVRAHEDVARVVEGLKQAGRKAILALNKIDEIRREELLAIAQTLHESGAYDEVLMISAEKGDGVDDLAKALAAAMPESPYLYPEDQIADLPERLLAAEVTREKLYLRVHEELPYSLTVETESWQERKDGSVRIEQTVYVEREGHKPIVLGKNGRTIKDVGSAARKELEADLGRKVHLFLHVKVRPGWGEERARYAAMGLDFDV
ncbi:GTPase Era [Marinicauda salina]|uniref:GTPase Era n=1 Tax=Marinicauda salina TaxID=2135793 RepID=A0A2U2BVA6_9PROT|nr:GTPase Era [Marinicauda salina]PWE17961.1 GTPase Era [Marinicauda salina]